MVCMGVCLTACVILQYAIMKSIRLPQVNGFNWVGVGAKFPQINLTTWAGSWHFFQVLPLPNLPYC